MNNLSTVNEFESTPEVDCTQSRSNTRLVLPAASPEPICDPLPASAYSPHLESFLSDDCIDGVFTAYDNFDCFRTYDEEAISDYVDRLMLQHNMFAWSINFKRMAGFGLPLSCCIEYYTGYPPRGFSVDLPPHTKRTWNVGGTICVLRSN